MAICIDIGNTAIKLGYFKNEHLERVQNVHSLQELKSTIEGNLLEDLIVSDVRKNTELNNFLINYDPIWVDYNLNFPFKSNYSTPSTLGSDRLTAITGCYALKYSAPFLVVDAGTCVTYDFVDRNNYYLGGAISPGIQLKLDSMHQHTGALPQLTFSKKNLDVNIIGNNTKSGLISGAFWATVFEIKGYLKTLEKQEKEKVKLILTGGFASFLAEKFENSTFVAPNLVLFGLHEILKLNASN